MQQILASTAKQIKLSLAHSLGTLTHTAGLYEIAFNLETKNPNEFI